MLGTAALLLAGLALLVVGAEVLVRGAVRGATELGISPLVAGLTVVAFGTSAPEAAVTLSALFGASADLAVGNVVGSNIFNLLVVVGGAALAAPLAVPRNLIRLDLPVMIVATLAFTAMALDRQIGRIDGGLLLAALVVYLWWAVRRSRAGRDNGMGGARPPALRPLLLSLAMVVVGLALLLLGSRWLVGAGVAIARTLGVSELVIGLTIIAAGTSLPEMATSVVAALRGQREIAVGNAVGSSIFNLLCVLGLAGLAAPHGVGVAASALTFDVPVMIGCSLACVPLFISGGRVSRLEGAALLACYAGYLGYVVYRAGGG